MPHNYDHSKSLISDYESQMITQTLGFPSEHLHSVSSYVEKILEGEKLRNVWKLGFFLKLQAAIVLGKGKL